MLVLARETGETILIEGGIRIAVVSVRGRTVRLGITCPGLAVWRGEIAEAARVAAEAEARAAVEGGR